jgi:hypothetical protein
MTIFAKEINNMEWDLKKKLIFLEANDYTNNTNSKGINQHMIKTRV